jgi:hypothetical protein
MSKIDKLKEQHPNLNVSIIDLLAKIDPSNTNKYLHFLINRLKEGYDYDEGDDIGLYLITEILGPDRIELLNEFDIHCNANRIPKNDISQYKSWDEMSDSVKGAEEILKQKELEKQVIKLLDTDEYCVVIPLSHEASKIYGSNTKWCTTQESHWLNYIDKYKLIYIIDRINNDKYAVSIKQGDSSKIQGWLADDKEVSPLTLPISFDVINIIISEIKKDETIMDLEDYKKIHSKIGKSKSKTDVGNQYHDSISQLINQYIMGIDPATTLNNPNNYTTYYDNGNYYDYSDRIPRPIPR